MFAGRKMLRSCHVAIICDQSNSLLKMLMVDAQKLSRTLVRQMILLFPVPQEDLMQAMSQMIFYNVTLRLGRNLRKGKVVLSTCFLFSCFKVPSDDACSSNTKLSQGRYVQVLVSFYLYDFEDQLLGFISDGFSHKLSEKTVITRIPGSFTCKW